MTTQQPSPRILNIVLYCTLTDSHRTMHVYISNAIKYPIDEQLTAFTFSTTHIQSTIHQFAPWTFTEVFVYSIKKIKNLNLYNLIINDI